MRDESKAYAKAIGAQNAIRGGTIQPSEIIINDSDIQLVSTNPPVFQVTSRVQRTGLSTYFATIFGVNAVDVVGHRRRPRFQVVWKQRITHQLQRWSEVLETLDRAGRQPRR